MIRVQEILAAIKPYVLRWIGTPVTYNPTWAGSGSNPAIGDGTLTAKYTPRGKKCVVEISVTMGAGTTYGTGNWSFSLPIAAANVGLLYLGVGLATDSSASSARYPLLVAVTPAVSTTAVSIIMVMTAGGTASNLTPSVPFTWASGDTLRLQFEYEVA